jgi:hypothetical protein
MCREAEKIKACHLQYITVVLLSKSQDGHNGNHIDVLA